jgi:hypothetical protein
MSSIRPTSALCYGYGVSPISEFAFDRQSSRRFNSPSLERSEWRKPLAETLENLHNCRLPSVAETPSNVWIAEGSAKDCAVRQESDQIRIIAFIAIEATVRSQQFI